MFCVALFTVLYGAFCGVSIRGNLVCEVCNVKLSDIRVWSVLSTHCIMGYFINLLYGALWVLWDGSGVVEELVR